MDFNLYQPIYNEIMPPLMGGIAALRNAYVEWVAGWIWLAVALVIGWRGWRTANGKQSFDDFKFDVGRAAFVYVVAANVGEYDQWVRAPLQGMADDLSEVAANAMGNGSVGRGGGPFDALLKDALLQGLRVWQRLGWSEIGPMFVVIVFWVMALIATAFGFLLRFGTELFLLILLSVGAVFIGLAAFESTRGKMFRWLDAVAQRIALMVLVVIFVQVLLTAEGELLRRFSGPGSTGVQQLVGLLLGIGLFGVASWLVKDLPRLASDMTGGSGSHGVGAAAAATFGAVSALGRRIRRAFA